MVPLLLQFCNDHFSHTPAREHAAKGEGVHVAEVAGNAVPKVCKGWVSHEVLDKGANLVRVSKITRILKPRVSRSPDSGQLAVRPSCWIIRRSYFFFIRSQHQLR